jgi:hypothetical protein
VTGDPNEKTMEIESSKPKPAASANKNAIGRLFFLEASGGGRILSVTAFEA